MNNMFQIVKNSSISKIFFIALTHGIIISLIFNVIGAGLLVGILLPSIIRGTIGALYGSLAGPLIRISILGIPIIFKIIIFTLPFAITFTIDFILGTSLTKNLNKIIRNSTRFLTESWLYETMFPKYPDNKMFRRWVFIGTGLGASIGIWIGASSITRELARDFDLSFPKTIAIIAFTIISLVIIASLRSVLKSSYIEIKNSKDNKNIFLFLSISLHAFSFISGFFFIRWLS